MGSSLLFLEVTVRCSLSLSLSLSAEKERERNEKVSPSLLIPDNLLLLARDGEEREPQQSHSRLRFGGRGLK